LERTLDLRDDALFLIFILVFGLRSSSSIFDSSSGATFAYLTLVLISGSLFSTASVSCQYITWISGDLESYFDPSGELFFRVCFFCSSTFSSLNRITRILGTKGSEFFRLLLLLDDFGDIEELSFEYSLADS